MCQNSVDLTEIIERPTPFCSFLIRLRKRAWVRGQITVSQDKVQCLQYYCQQKQTVVIQNLCVHHVVFVSHFSVHSYTSRVNRTVTVMEIILGNFYHLYTMMVYSFSLDVESDIVSSYVIVTIVWSSQHALLWYSIIISTRCVLQPPVVMISSDVLYCVLYCTLFLMHSCYKQLFTYIAINTSSQAISCKQVVWIKPRQLHVVTAVSVTT